MQKSDDKAKRWQISLKMVFGFVALVAVEIWQLQHGLLPLFVPLLIATVLELYGYRNSAHCVMAATICATVFVLCRFLIWIAHQTA